MSDKVARLNALLKDVHSSSCPDITRCGKGGWRVGDNCQELRDELREVIRDKEIEPDATHAFRHYMS